MVGPRTWTAALSSVGCVHSLVTTKAWSKKTVMHMHKLLHCDRELAELVKDD